MKDAILSNCRALHHEPGCAGTNSINLLQHCSDFFRQPAEEPWQTIPAHQDFLFGRIRSTPEPAQRGTLNLGVLYIKTVVFYVTSVIFHFSFFITSFYDALP